METKHRGLRGPRGRKMTNKDEDEIGTKETERGKAISL